MKIGRWAGLLAVAAFLSGCGDFWEMATLGAAAHALQSLPLDFCPVAPQMSSERKSSFCTTQ